MSTPASPKPSAKLVLPSDLTLDEAAERGYISRVLVELEPDRLYPVFFSTPGRLAGELAESAKHGEPFIVETGMIVVAEITLANLEAAVTQMVAEGYFDYMVPLTRERVAAADPFVWPP